MCSRQDASHAQTASAPHARTLSSFASSIARETSAFLTANVPPKPQHSSASGSSTSSTPGTAEQERQRASPSRSSRSEWQVGWYVTEPAKGGADVDAPRSTRNSDSSHVRAVTPRSPPEQAGTCARTCAAHEPDGVDDRVVAVEDRTNRRASAAPRPGSPR